MRDRFETEPNIVTELARIDERLKAVEEDSRLIAEKLEALSGIASYGKGALWALLKLGGLLILIGAAAASLTGWSPIK
jgi:hypothetical protein